MGNHISVYCGPSRHQAWLTTRIVFAALFLWFFAIAFLTVLMAVAAIDWVYARAGGETAFNGAMLAALTVATIVVAPTVLIRLVRPQLTLSVLALMTTGAVVALATGAGALLDLFVVVVIGLAAYGVGRLALDRLVQQEAGPPLEALVLATGLGVGLLGLIALALGLLGWLRLPAVVGVLVPLAVMVIWRCARWLASRVQTYGLGAVFAPAWN
jgi:hypothetical protein